MPPDPSPVKLGEVLLQDSFDSPTSGRLSRYSSAPDVDQGYVAGEYLFRLGSSFKENLRFVGPDEVFANTQVELDSRLVGGTETRWLGVACRILIKDGAAVGAYMLRTRRPQPAPGWPPQSVCFRSYSPMLRGTGGVSPPPSSFVRSIPHAAKQRRWSLQGATR